MKKIKSKLVHLFVMVCGISISIPTIILVPVIVAYKNKINNIKIINLDQEQTLFHNNNEVRDYFINKNNHQIEINNYKGSVEVNVDVTNNTNRKNELPLVIL